MSALTTRKVAALTIGANTLSVGLCAALVLAVLPPAIADVSAQSEAHAATVVQAQVEADERATLTELVSERRALQPARAELRDAIERLQAARVRAEELGIVHAFTVDPVADGVALLAAAPWTSERDTRAAAALAVEHVEPLEALIEHVVAERAAEDARKAAEEAEKRRQQQEQQYVTPRPGNTGTPSTQPAPRASILDRVLADVAAFGAHVSVDSFCGGSLGCVYGRWDGAGRPSGSDHYTLHIAPRAAQDAGVIGHELAHSVAFRHYGQGWGGDRPAVVAAWPGLSTEQRAERLADAALKARYDLGGHYQSSFTQAQLNAGAALWVGGL